MAVVLRLVLALALLLGPVAALATDYWVSSVGSDANDGLSLGTAWATLVHASGRVAAGDTVHVRPGSYQGFYLAVSGIPSSPITFVAEGMVSIDADNPGTPDGINVENADHVVIDGFTVLGRTRAGIRAALSDFVTVRNCTCGDNGTWGIFTGHTDDFTAEYNETYGSIAEHGIYVSNSSDRPTIRGNLIHGNNANGIHLNGDLSQGGHGLIHDALIEANVIYGNGTSGSAINGDGLVDSVIRNNLIYDNHNSGISLYRIDAGAGASGNLVANNTIINAADGRWCINIRDGSTGNTVVNNILYDFHAFRGVITIDGTSRPGFTSDHNSLMTGDRYSINGDATRIGFAAWQAQGYDANSLLATPTDHFVGPSVDFHLLATSPAIDAGAAAGAPSTDLDGNPRPVGASYDLGAYELQLLHCGDGAVDPGEQCGEPTLACTDPCTSCSRCVCALDEPVCGDALVCGDEQCESDGDCGSGQTCNGCACETPAPCASGLVLDKPHVLLRSNPPRLRLKGRVTVPTVWSGVDPIAAGVRLVVDHASQPQRVDIVVPGGGNWRSNGKGTKWSYVDPTASVAGIARLTIRYDASKQPGLAKFVAKGIGPQPLDLPGDDAARLHAIFGASEACASVVFESPTGSRPRCAAGVASLECR